MVTGKKAILAALALLGSAPLGGCLAVYHESSVKERVVSEEFEGTVLWEGAHLPTGRVTVDWAEDAEGLAVSASREILGEKSVEVLVRKKHLKECRAGKAHATGMFGPAQPLPGREVAPSILLGIDIAFVVPVILDLVMLRAGGHDFGGGCREPAPRVEEKIVTRLVERGYWEPAEGLAVHYTLGNLGSGVAVTDAKGVARIPLPREAAARSGMSIEVTATAEGIPHQIHRTISGKEMQKLMEARP